ncbi:MAG: DUF445 family protein [Flavipsychrobacter sp.]|nr:DUF445 family protein [Flavipsychrobacter sp.]
MHLIMFYLQPFVAAFTGWFTTWIAIYMLFHPREPKRFFGITIQGIFPKRQKQFAAKLGAVVANELLHFNDIAALIKDPDQLADLKPGIEAHVDTFLHVKLKEKLPVISMFVGEGMLNKIKEGLMEEIDLLLPEIISKYTNNLTQKVDIEKMVTERVSNFSSDKLEEILAAVMSKEFRFVELIGGVLGFVIGLIQMGLSFL